MMMLFDDHSESTREGPPSFGRDPRTLGYVVRRAAELSTNVFDVDYVHS